MNLPLADNTEDITGQEADELEIHNDSSLLEFDLKPETSRPPKENEKSMSQMSSDDGDPSMRDDAESNGSNSNRRQMKVMESMAEVKASKEEQVFKQVRKQRHTEIDRKRLSD